MIKCYAESASLAASLCCPLLLDLLERGCLLLRSCLQLSCLLCCLPVLLSHSCSLPLSLLLSFLMDLQQHRARSAGLARSCIPPGPSRQARPHVTACQAVTPLPPAVTGCSLWQEPHCSPAHAACPDDRPAWTCSRVPAPQALPQQLYSQWLTSKEAVPPSRPVRQRPVPAFSINKGDINIHCGDF